MRKKTRGITCFLLSILLILLPTFGTQASGGRDILGKGTDYTAILYDSSNGLPTSEANAIAQTGNGFIWFGGYSGLIRYDGTNFKRIDSSGGISSVFSLFVDSKDRLWIGTNENGLAYMENGEPFVYGRSEALQSYSIRDITEDKNGNILVATTQGMAYVGEDMELHPIDDPQIKTEYVNQLEKDASGNIFGLTLNGAIFQMNDLRISAFYEPDEFGDDPVNCIYADPVQPSIIYMGTQGEEILTASFGRSMNITAKDNCSPLKNINDMLRIGDYLWVCATGGVGYFNEKNRFCMIDDSPINSSVGDIMQDMEGNLWFTSTRQGIMKLVADRFTDITKLANLDPMVVNSTCVNDGALYLGTDKGLTIVNLSTYRTRTNEITELLTDVRIRCIKNDSRGNLWFCTHGDHGLVCYDPKTGSIKEYNSANGLEASRVRAVLELSDGSMAAATGDGLFIVNNGRVVANYGKDNGISTTEILSVAEDDNGRIYLGSDGDGIYVIDKNKVSRIGYEDGLTSEVVMRIKKDEKRNMFWLITSNSIEYMKDGVVTAVSNFPYSNNYDIYFDDKDGAWILASNGIYITEVEDLIANKNIDYSFYNIKSGLPYITTGNSRNHLDKDGKLYISGTTGTCAVNINADSTSTENVLLAIPSVELDDKTVNISEGDTVSIPAGCKRLVINGYALTYGLSNPRITYYLDGFDKEPVHTTKQDLQPVIYTNLDGGRYVFYLNVINDNTGEVMKTMTVNITKERSVYESLLFWFLLAAIIILAFAVTIYRYFSRKNEELLKKQEEDRQFINQIMRAFAKCIDMRDTQNRGHSFRVAYYTRLLAEKLSETRGYTEEQIEEFYNIALLHDIGKIGIEDKVLNKTERLNDEEFLIMKTHAAKGEDMLKGVKVLRDFAIGAGYHHERMDGKGYPHGLKGTEIPEVARVIAVADTFDAMYSTRPYRKQLELSVVLEELKRIKGSQLEGEVVDAMLKLAEEGKLDKEKADASAVDAPETDADNSSKGKCGNENSVVSDSDSGDDMDEDRKFLDDLGLGGPKK